MLADKGCSSRAIRGYLRSHGIPATTPERAGQKANRARRGSHGGRPRFCPVAYRRRNIVERCFAQLKQYRAVATRHDKTALSCQARIDLATLKLWL